SDIKDYQARFYEKYQGLIKIKGRLKESNREAHKDENTLALQLINEIFEVKKVPESERKEWFLAIHDEACADVLI
ncbi:MAG: hypothetical protein GX660_11245, partial [Clostridiaceae bacterium]|nr:hypothetical protein [Clostridiaceae bacterium]